MSTVPLALQIAAVRAEAEAAASYAASPAVRNLPMLAGPANARRDALAAAIVTLEAVETLEIVHEGRRERRRDVRIFERGIVE